MSDLYEEAYKEALATAVHKVALDTLQISNPDAPTGDLFLVNYLHDVEAALTDGGSVELFKATAFSFRSPEKDDEGVTELPFSLDNVDRSITDWLKEVVQSDHPIEMKYRAYLLEDLSKPQTKTPIRLFVESVTVDSSTVVGRARFTDFVNTPFPKQVYSRRRFPALR